MVEDTGSVAAFLLDVKATGIEAAIEKAIPKAAMQANGVVVAITAFEAWIGFKEIS